MPYDQARQTWEAEYGPLLEKGRQLGAAAQTPYLADRGGIGTPNYQAQAALRAWNLSPEGQKAAQLYQQGVQSGYINPNFHGGTVDRISSMLPYAGMAALTGGALGLFGAGAATTAAPAAGTISGTGLGGATGIGALTASTPTVSSVAGLSGGALTGAAAGGGGAVTGAPALAGGISAPSAVAGTAPWYQSLVGPVAGSLVGGGLSLYGANNAANKLSDAANSAADKAKFTPYNVFSGAGSGTFDGTTATAKLSPEYQALRNQYLQNANGNLSALQNYDPQAAANDVYGKLSALSNPQEEQDRLNQENRLLAQGMLGSTGGGIQRQALLTSQGLAGVGRQVQSYQLGQDALNQMQNRAFGATNAATSLDAIPMNNLNTGGVFGGRASQANQYGAGLQYLAAGAGAGASASFWQGLGQQISPGVSSAVNNYYANGPGSYNSGGMFSGSPYVPNQYGGSGYGGSNYYAP